MFTPIFGLASILPPNSVQAPVSFMSAQSCSVCFDSALKPPGGALCCSSAATMRSLPEPASSTRRRSAPLRNAGIVNPEHGASQIDQHATPLHVPSGI